MIHPSYTELIDAINTNNEEDARNQVLNSRYSLVLATSKRARQLIAGAKPLVENAAGKKPLAIAIDELYKGKVKILAETDGDEELLLEETDGETPDDVIEETYVDEAAEPDGAVSADSIGTEEAAGAETGDAEEAAGAETNETEEASDTEADETSDAGDGAETADAAPEE